MTKPSVIFSLYNDKRTVFTLSEVSMLIQEPDFSRLKQKLNYYVRKGMLYSVRRGIYVKEAYNPEELACKLYAPSYLSLHYVLQKTGVIFQYANEMTMVSYLSRTVEADEKKLVYRKIKNSVLVNTQGIDQLENGVSIASAERAVLDTLYLDKDYYFDRTDGLQMEIIKALLPAYQSAELYKRASKIFQLTPAS